MKVFYGNGETHWYGKKFCEETIRSQTPKYRNIYGEGSTTGWMWADKVICLRYSLNPNVS